MTYDCCNIKRLVSFNFEGPTLSSFIFSFPFIYSLNIKIVKLDKLRKNYSEKKNEYTLYDSEIKDIGSSVEIRGEKSMHLATADKSS